MRCGGQHAEHLRDQRFEVGHAIASCANHEDGYRSPCEILLEPETLIERDERRVMVWRAPALSATCVSMRAPTSDRIAHAGLLERQTMADDRLGPAKAPAPCFVAEDGEGCGAYDVIRWTKGAAEHRLRAEDVEVVPRHERSPKAQEALVIAERHRPRAFVGK